jgi:hypothetical protein
LEARKGFLIFRHMIVVYMQDTLKMLGEFPKPTRVGQTSKGAYVVYEFPIEESNQPIIA